MPMWLLSGSFFPPSGAPVWIQWIIRVNPLTYGVAAIRRSLYLEELYARAELPSFAVSILVTALFAALVFAATTRTAR
jgi:ABC-2 type transport system permease protein